MNREIWRTVVGHECYMVSNLGNVKRTSSQSKPGTGNYERHERMVTQRVNNKGYCMVDLWENGKRTQRLVHRLVAEAFLPNKHDLPEVNHRDENSRNNCLDNLEWCNHEYNMNYGTLPARIARANGKPVKQMTLDGRLIAKYPSAFEAQRATGINNARISECCLGKTAKAGGYIWTQLIS